MTKTKVLVSRLLPPRVMSEAQQRFQLTQRQIPAPMKQDEAIRSLETFDAIIPTLGDDFSSQTFNQVDNLQCRILANFGAGYNHIDIAAAQKRGIVVSNTPGAVTDATADITLALILMTARRTAEGDRLVRADQWTGWHPTQMLGTQVSGQTLGIIGMGNIGKAIALRCQAGFGMKVVFFNRSLVSNPGVIAEQLNSAEDVANRADFVVIAVRGGASSYHLVSEKLLGAMRSDAILINISRGDVVDEKALIKALKAKQIAGAGLDVYEFEPKVPKELKTMDNVVLLPHLGTSVLKVREEMGMMALDNLSAFFATGKPPNQVV
ncbi:MAG: D-glycerate dehydrogenase [Rhodobacteraceae bacterium]|nr:D-glycerate dehydrogenase [Paracoccaceae bacterium]